VPFPALERSRPTTHSKELPVARGSNVHEVANTCALGLKYTIITYEQQTSLEYLGMLKLIETFLSSKE
jgi:hypothetical protein